MVRKLALLILFVLESSWGASYLSATPGPEDLDAKLTKRVTNYNLGVFNMVHALIQVSTDFRIPMGIALVNSPDARALMPFAWKDSTVRHIIEDICNAHPGCRFEIGRGLVHVSSVLSVPYRENFLHKTLETFALHDAEIELASAKLHVLVTPIKGNHQISVAGPGDSKVSLELRNSTVRDALDALILSSNRKIWIVEFSASPVLTTAGLRRTDSLFTTSAIRDEEQPVWYLHRWGDPLPQAVATGRETAPK